MGMGDELIAAGQARALHALDGRKVIIRDRHDRIRWHELWRNNPAIISPHDRAHKAHEIKNGPGARPYIAAKSDTRWTWKEFTCTPAALHFFPDEIELSARQGRPDIVIEPMLKAKASPNKDWGRPRWEALVGLMRRAGMRPVQLGTAGTQRLHGCDFIETPSFRLACAVLARARACVVPEGGLHHAAAALSVPAVVIYGGYISPRQTGYESQANLFTGGEPCGMRIPCEHCTAAMEQITPALVMENLLKVMRDATVSA